jgi:hypothetical protein
VPSQILHTLFGEDVIAGIDRTLQVRFGIEEDSRFSFVLGCQGPDIFYHNQMTRPVGLEYGTLLHRRGSGAFTAALLQRALPDLRITALGAYALGFMTHAILDRACHPYIVYKTARTGGGGGARNIHAFFERILDVLMLEELRGKPAAFWDQNSLAQICDDPPKGLKELLAESLRQAFPERAGKDVNLGQRMDNTFRDCAWFYRYTAPGRTSFRHPQTEPQGELPNWREIIEEIPLVYLYPEDLPDDIDYLNREHRAWYYPAGDSPADTRSFPDIYAQALDSAVAILSPLIAAYLETGVFPILEAARSIGNGGLSIQDADGTPCAPSRSDPLPLERVLEQQRRLRATS